MSASLVSMPRAFTCGAVVSTARVFPLITSSDTAPGLSTTRDVYIAPPMPMSPLLSIQVYHEPPVYRPGEVMRFDYQIDAIDEPLLSAVEASVLWQTEGKGDQDIGVHFFERRVPGDTDGEDLRALRTCYVALPKSPLSYHGEILQVRWLIRVRVFVRGAKEHVVERPFLLSTTVAPTPARLTPHE